MANAPMPMASAMESQNIPDPLMLLCGLTPELSRPAREIPVLAWSHEAGSA
jgi:hypothetical protein